MIYQISFAVILIEKKLYPGGYILCTKKIIAPGGLSPSKTGEGGCRHVKKFLHFMVLKLTKYIENIILFFYKLKKSDEIRFLNFLEKIKWPIDMFH